MQSYLAFVIPAFFVLIGLELWLARVQRRKLYRFEDAIADLGCGISQQVVTVFMTGAILAGYGWLHDHVAPFSLGNTAAAWIIGFFAVDVAYYWWHRSSHRVSLLWATHAAHHQSQDYNLAVALRQAWFSEVSSIPFYYVLAVAGLPLPVFIAHKSISTLYQFWIHTRTVGKLHPAFEFIFNTPAHHRVHHGINPQYIDRNHAATLIIWDRLFGTFEEEREEAVFGTVEPFKSWNPVWANFEYFAKIASVARTLPRWQDRFRIWWKPPGWHPATGEGVVPPVDAKTFVQWETPPVHLSLRLYILGQFAVTAFLTTLYLYFNEKLTWEMKATGAAFIILALVTWSGFFERKSWAYHLEMFRIAGGATALLLILFFQWPFFA